MRNFLILAGVFGVVGLIVGYLIFGRLGISNELIRIGDLFFSGSGRIVEGIRQVAGFAEKRQNIYISGGVGALLGVSLGMVLRRQR